MLLKRLHNNPAANRDTAYFGKLEGDIQDCLLAFILPQQCYHATMERLMANPYVSNTIRPSACFDACSFCKARVVPIFPSLVKEGVRTVLMQLFLGPLSMVTRPVIDKALVDSIRNFKGSNRLIFGVNSDKKPEPLLVKKTILMLLAARILNYVVDRKETTLGNFQVNIFGTLAFLPGDNTRLALSEDSSFALIPLKE